MENEEVGIESYGRDDDAGIGRVRGTAMKYGSKADKYGVINIFAPGSFKRSLENKSRSSRRDVRLLQQHDDGKPLARMRGGGFRVTDSDTALTFEADLDIARSARIRDAFEDIDSGLVDETSVGVRVVKDEWDDSNPKQMVRTIFEAELVEISVVTMGAFPGTTARSYAEDDRAMVECYAASKGVEAPETFDSVPEALERIRSLHSEPDPATMSEEAAPPAESTEPTPPQSNRAVRRKHLLRMCQPT